MSELSPVLKQRFFDSNGVPLAGGLVYTYEAGTSTPLETYTDETGDTPNTNPVVLDSTGSAAIWMGEASYKFVVADANENIQFTTDVVQSIAQQIATQIDIAGALSAANNLSDVDSVASSLENLGISPYTYPTKFSFTSGQSATNLSGEIVSNATYSSVRYEFEIVQGTTIMANGVFVLQSNVIAGWTLSMGETIDNGNINGVVFSVAVTGGSGQIQAAETGSLGNGTIKLKKSYFPITP